MNEKEIGEIRRRVRRDRSNMTALYGCYVNERKEIISEFCQSVGIMPENEGEKYFALLRRTLTGGIGKNLIDISFRTAQVADSPEHKLLMDLRRTALKDDETRLRFYKTVIEALTFPGSYLILAGCDSYDVPFRGKDGASEPGEETYTYLLCGVCPVKQSKPALRYIPESRDFHDSGVAQTVSAPELGFLFPAFDDRATNLYGALYYTHSPKENYSAVAEALFHVPIPKPAAEQKQSFDALLSESLDEECSLEVVQTVHDYLRQAIELHKQSKVPEPLLISKEQVGDALKKCGVSEEHAAKFSVDYDRVFGFEAELHPKNIIDSTRFEITTPDVSIRVNPERSDLIETRIIGGVKYLLIPADENVEVNGVDIRIGREAPAPV